jgi:hypothetical protein
MPYYAAETLHDMEGIRRGHACSWQTEIPLSGIGVDSGILEMD